MESIKRRREFEEALRNIIAKLRRDEQDRINRSYIEEIGQRYDLKPDQARKLFVESRGDIWKGELIESEGEPGWEVAKLERSPATGISEDSSV